MNTNRKMKLWCGFVYELRCRGYWGDPEKYRDWFNQFFGDYIKGKDMITPIKWYYQHCCDNIKIEVNGHKISEWTDHEQSQVDIEYNKCMQRRGRSKIIDFKPIILPDVSQEQNNKMV